MGISPSPQSAAPGDPCVPCPVEGRAARSPASTPPASDVRPGTEGKLLPRAEVGAILPLKVSGMYLLKQPRFRQVILPETTSEL